MSAARPGIVLRLNAGVYNIVGTCGDANALVRADVTVEAGKLTEATLVHAAAKVTLGLVAHAGGDAIANPQWTIARRAGQTVAESVGALPTTSRPAPHGQRAQRRSGIPAPVRREAGDTVQVEVMRR